MKKGKMDRRVKYTKMMLKNALVKLIQDQHISSISVKELCEIADINRSTFYAHYTDIYDLLHQLEEEVMANVQLYLEKEDNDKSRSVPDMTRILEYAQENADLFQILLGENSDYVFQKDIIELSHVITAQYEIDIDERTKAYLRSFGVAGCVSILQKWFKDGTVESPGYISALIIQALQRGTISFQ